jgi:hypothetical protein
VFAIKILKISRIKLTALRAASIAHAITCSTRRSFDSFQQFFSKTQFTVGSYQDVNFLALD